MNDEEINRQFFKDLNLPVPEEKPKRARARKKVKEPSGLALFALCAALEKVSAAAEAVSPKPARKGRSAHQIHLEAFVEHFLRHGVEVVDPKTKIKHLHFAAYHLLASIEMES